MSESLYLLGHPTAHSKSPAMHNALYQELGISWRYGLKDYESEPDARAFIVQKEFVGINITTPYKELAFSCADVCAASAKLAQGANVLARKDQTLLAYNVDGEGCISFLERSGFRFLDALVVVCGTGPTSLAILHAAALAGARKVVLIGRNKERCEKRLNSYLKEFERLAHATIELPPLHEGHRSFRAAYDETVFTFGSYRSSQQIFAKADLIINATSVGMKDGESLPFDKSLLHEGQTIYDVVYGQGETDLLVNARAQGCRVFDGAGMLVAQAVATDKILFEIAGLTFETTDDDMFDIMARAAGFEC